MKNWRSARVFISSTFRDMHSERDYLVKVVFPRLRERLEPYRVELIDIDLRWGITERQASDGRVLELCLQQIDECRPYFVCLLGQRYGWVPETVPGATLDVYTWLEEQSRKSITELEILHGVLNDPDRIARAFFYFREPESLDGVPEDIVNRVYRDPDPIAQQKLARLKERIFQGGYPVTPYTARWDPEYVELISQTRGRFVGLEDLGRSVEEQLFTAITADAGQTEPPGAEDDLDREIEYHDRFMLLDVYVGSLDLRNALLDFVHGDVNKPLLLAGPPGSGKSAALVHLARDLREEQTVVVAHFVGASPRSTNLRETLIRLCRQLSREFSLEMEIPETIGGCTSAFHAILRSIPPDRRVVLIVDGIDLFEEVDQPRELNWIPPSLGPNVRMVLSCIDDSSPDQRALLRAGELRLWRIDMPALTDEQCREIIRRVPSMVAKTLDENQIDLLMSNSGTRNPLFLLVALEELKGFGSFEQLSERISAFPDAEVVLRGGGTPVEGIFVQVIHRLSGDFDAQLVMHVLCLLACARRGLTEGELRGLVDTLPGRDDLYPVLRQLRPYLIRRAERIGFFHRGLRDAVEYRYLHDANRLLQCHQILASFFGGVIDPREINTRIVEEFPWHLCKAGEWDSLYAFLANLHMLAALDSEAPSDIDLYWSNLESESGYRIEDAYRQVIQDPTRHMVLFCHYSRSHWPVFLKVSRLLAHFGRYAESEALLERILADSDPDSYEYRACMRELKNTYINTGRIKEALSLPDVQLDGGSNEDWDLLYSAVAWAKKGKFARCLDLAVRVEASGREKGDGEVVAQALAIEAHALIEQQMYDRAWEVLKEVESIARERQDMTGLAVCLGNQAVIHRWRGHLETALKLHEEQVGIFHRFGNRRGKALSLGQMGTLYEAMDKQQDAQICYAEAVSIYREFDDVDGLDYARERQGFILSNRGEYGEALACYEECEQLRERMGNTASLTKALMKQVELLEKLEDAEKLERKRRKLEQLEKRV